MDYKSPHQHVTIAKQMKQDTSTLSRIVSSLHPPVHELADDSSSNASACVASKASILAIINACLHTPGSPPDDTDVSKTQFSSHLVAPRKVSPIRFIPTSIYLALSDSLSPVGTRPVRPPSFISFQLPHPTTRQLAHDLSTHLIGMNLLVAQLWGLGFPIFIKALVNASTITFAYVVIMGLAVDRTWIVDKNVQVIKPKKKGLVSISFLFVVLLDPAYIFPFS